jgi:hypothetical protein
MKNDFESINPDLEIKEYADSHKQGFKIQRLGIIIILAIVLSAALGVFGDGMLSRQTLELKSARIEYQKFYRFEARMEVRIELLEIRNSNVVSFPKEYLKEFEIESITPSPESTNFKGTRSEFVFSGPGNGFISFFLVPRNVGKIEGDLLVNDDKFEMSHFIYP